MALIAMAVHDTVENKKHQCTRQTIESILKTVDYRKHRLIVVNNNSCDETKHYLSQLSGLWYWKYRGETINEPVVLTNAENLGTAAAINKAWKHRKEGEHAIKMDNDVVIHNKDWVDQMEEAIRRKPDIGVLGLKRKDLWQNPDHPNPNYKSVLKMLPQDGNGAWMVFEETADIMGTCTMFNSALLDKIGFLYQPGLYGYDDVLASARSRFAGFVNGFLPHIEIDHIDDGATPYQTWKEKHSGQYQPTIDEIIYAYRDGRKSIYYAG